MKDQEPKEKDLTYTSVKSFIEKTRLLLKEEQKYEIDLFNEMTSHKTIQQIESQGCGLSNMVIRSSRLGFYGKTIITLTKASYSQKNPVNLPQQCKMQVGDDVAIYRNNAIIADGVIYKRVGGKIKISSRAELEEENDLEGLSCNIVLKWNQVTFKRYYAVLNDMENSQTVLFREFFPSHASSHVHASYSKVVQYNNPKINLEQNQAVRSGLSELVHLIHGPPGTGKTTTVCDLIVEAVNRGQKVLACAPSNIAVDNMVEALYKRTNCVRIGNPARIIESVIERCLDFLIAKNTNLWKNEVKKLAVARKKLTKTESKNQKRALFKQIKQIRDQIYMMQEQTIQQILNDTDVICCTNVGAADRAFKRYLSKRTFDLVVIDQCGQSLQVSCWIPLLKGRRAVLAGDHKQLPPTIQGDKAGSTSLLSYTLFSRAMEQLKNISSTMLKVQYRMNKTIMGWSNKMFYDQQLLAHQSVENHQLKHLYKEIDAEEQVLMMVDTSGCGMGEEGEANQSKLNVGEADIILSIYRKLINYGVQAQHIAILTPYSKQVAYIKNLLQQSNIPMPDISTVDGIQGRQKECILMSLVRSNKKREIGFLKDWRRMNVAVTRARRMLIIVGNSQCVKSDAHMETLVSWIEQNGHIRSAQEFKSDPNVRFGLGASDKIEEYEGKLENKNNKNKKKEKPKEKEKDKSQMHSQAESEAFRDHYRQIFSTINKEITIKNASAFERKMVHEVAQELNLAHQTSEDKKLIRVWQKLTSEQLKEKLQELQEEAEAQQEAQLTKPKKKKKNNKNQQKGPTKGVNKGPGGANKFSAEMKNLIGQQSSEGEQDEKVEQTEKKDEKKEEDCNIQVVPQAKSKKKKNKNKENVQKGQQQQLEELNAVLMQIGHQLGKKDECYKCSRKITSVTSVECRFCHLNFCRNHVLAQQHGCDEQAKAAARKDKDMQFFIKQGAQRIKQKIKQQEDLRKRKPKEKEKK